LESILGAMCQNEVAGMKAKFFRTPADFRAWLEKHHARSLELLVGFYKRESGKPSITWRESVGEALCFGWIDGVRRRVDEVSYTIRFTPRKPGSTWSTVNIERAKNLAAEGRMQPAGSRAYEARRSNKSGVYSYEQRPDQLVPPYAGMLARRPAAKKFFAVQAPSYRRAAIWWVISAKQDETRLRRARTLIGLSAQGKWIPQFVRKPSRR
jgi:uncharacterized protein YdeI (YjbR/CyaY-like superfamily)